MSESAPRKSTSLEELLTNPECGYSLALDSLDPELRSTCERIRVLQKLEKRDAIFIPLALASGFLHDMDKASRRFVSVVESNTQAMVRVEHARRVAVDAANNKYLADLAGIADATASAAEPIDKAVTQLLSTVTSVREATRKLDEAANAVVAIDDQTKRLIGNAVAAASVVAMNESLPAAIKSALEEASLITTIRRERRLTAALIIAVFVVGVICGVLLARGLVRH